MSMHVQVVTQVLLSPAEMRRVFDTVLEKQLDGVFLEDGAWWVAAANREGRLPCVPSQVQVAAWHLFSALREAKR